MLIGKLANLKPYKLLLVFANFSLSIYTRILLLFLRLFFSTVVFEGVRYHSFKRNNKNDIYSVIQKSSDLLAQSSFEKSNEEINIYDFQSSMLYFLFNPFAPLAFGYYSVFTNNIFIYHGDFSNGIAKAPRKQNNTQSLEGLIAHEIVHFYQAKTYGCVKFYFSPVWVIEGYATYISKTSSLGEQKGLEFIRSKRKYENIVEWYYYSYSLIKHALEFMELDISELHQGKYSIETISESLYA